MNVRSAVSIILILILIISIVFFSHRRAVNQKKLKELNDELREAVGENDIALVKDLLEKGADSQKGLLAAASWNNKEIVKLMLDNGANPNKYKEETPLIRILGTSHENVMDVVKLLVSHGANVNYKIPSVKRQGMLIIDGRTPLIIAVEGNRVDVVKFLISKGAEIDAQSGGSGYTALNIAIKREYNEIVNILLAKGANISFYDAIVLGYLDKVRDFIKSGIDVNKPILWETPLILAIQNGHKEILSLLIREGADVNAGGRINNLLALAINEGHFGIVELLLQNGADINAKAALIEQSTESNSDLRMIAVPLVRAVERGKEEIVELLISEGADVNGIDEWEGLTPLDIAEKEGMNEIAEILRKHGGKRSSELNYIE